MKRKCHHREIDEIQSLSGKTLAPSKLNSLPYSFREKFYCASKPSIVSLTQIKNDFRSNKSFLPVWKRVKYTPAALANSSFALFALLRSSCLCYACEKMGQIIEKTPVQQSRTKSTSSHSEFCRYAASLFGYFLLPFRIFETLVMSHFFWPSFNRHFSNFVWFLLLSVVPFRHSWRRWR